uniref:ATP synthase subunit epsilon, mitochondrial n=1 Tax=Elaeophora elaphi TaxID=1147741 RepID=A0A0R3RJT7_9BILA
MWRQMGINYVRYSQIAASATRKCLKKGLKKEVEKPVTATVKITPWENGKPVKKD